MGWVGRERGGYNKMLSIKVDQPSRCHPYLYMWLSAPPSHMVAGKVVEVGAYITDGNG